MHSVDKKVLGIHERQCHFLAGCVLWWLCEERWALVEGQEETASLREMSKIPF